MAFVSKAVVLIVVGIAASPAISKDSPFHAGPVITEFGKIATVQTDMAIPKNAEFRVVFDASQKADPGKINQVVTSAARFINMHVDAGVPAENIDIAVVVHGGASADVTNQSHYKSNNENRPNATAAAIEILLEHRVEIYLCGQSAAAHGIGNSDLLPGVKMALSAMTAHSLLLQDGYTPNPF